MATAEIAVRADVYQLRQDAKQLAVIQETVASLNQQREQLEKSIATFCDADERLSDYTERRVEFQVGETLVSITKKEGWLSVRARKHDVLKID